MSVQVQVIGTLKCKDTQKVLRFFKERSIQAHFLDLNQKGISKGELNNISRSIPLDDLIDKESKEFKNKNMQYMVYDIAEALLENSLLLKTPITRFGSKVVAGFDATKLNLIAKDFKQ
jgi:arsenate reductase (glutaredoxin)